MPTQSTIPQLAKGQYAIMPYVLALGVFMVLNVGVDYLFALLRDSDFYWSESLLFAMAYWGLYLLILPRLMNKRFLAVGPQVGWIILAVIMHLLIYPLLVTLFSMLFLDHVFGYVQTLSYGLATYCVPTILIYTFPIIIANRTGPYIPRPSKVPTPEAVSIHNLVVTDTDQSRRRININDVCYFQADMPYISIHVTGKKYLYAGSLKSLSEGLDANQFVRVHKSHIINLSYVSAYQSRHNGDYDVTMHDGTELRISRNYARQFKNAYKHSHHVTPS